MPQQQKSLKERSAVRNQEPPVYNVVFHNDDFTPMDLVEIILQVVFLKTPAEATDLMLKVHNSDKAVVGSYTYDIALSKADRAQRIARQYDAPLKVTVEQNYEV